MVKLKSRSQCPINGFHYNQPQTGAAFMSWGFEDLCQQVQSHRKGNPRFSLSLDMDEIRAEVDFVNATRMLSIPGGEAYIITDEPSPPKSRLRSPRSFPAAVAGARKVAAGVGVLLDWLGNGGVPVSAEKAQIRAEACATCPKNKQGDLTSWFTVPASELLKKQIEVRNDMKLATIYDDRLGVCEACACPLKLKVHTGLDHIREHMTPEIQAELDIKCWILAESEQSKA